MSEDRAVRATTDDLMERPHTGELTGRPKTDDPTDGLR
jgi:hypothetical protein